MNPVRRSASILASNALAAIAALHFLWATGSSWPAKDASTIAGTADGKAPGPVACVTVGTTLAAATALVAGFGQDRRIWRLGRDLVGAVLAVRGTAGVTGKTELLVPGHGASAAFKQLDRTRYGPLCLILAALILISRPRA